MFLGGTKQLLGQPEFKDTERMRELLGVLEEEQMLKDMLKASSDSGLRVTIGSENKFSSIQDCSMIQATYRLNGQVRWDPCRVGTYPLWNTARSFL